MDPRVTIVVVPRERFSAATASLASLLAHTPPPYQLVYVDGGSPRPVRDHLRRLAVERGFELVRTDHYLSPNQARNLGIARATGEYVVFVDNDVLVTPGWLDALVRCADETGAWAVGPTYLFGPLDAGVVHMAGASMHIRDVDGVRRFEERHGFSGQRFADVASSMERNACDLVEFHTALVRRNVLEELGPLDERLLSRREHVDLCLQIAAAGGTIFHEPGSVVTYLAPPPFATSDYPFFMLRWSNEWNRRTLDHFHAKWRLDADDPKRARSDSWAAQHRRWVFGPVEPRLRQLLPARVVRKLERLAMAPVEQTLVRWAGRRRWTEVPKVIPGPSPARGMIGRPLVATGSDGDAHGTG